MKNRTLLILESSQNYGERLAAFIGRQENSPFMTQLYLAHPIADEKWKKADAVLITSSLMAQYGEKSEEKKVMILDEGGQLSGIQERSVYKYQSAGVIYQSVMEFCVENGSICLDERRNGKRQCICTGIYQAVNSEDSWMKILDICRQKGKKGCLIYVNFEAMTAFDTYMEGEKKGEGLSEIIYFVKQRSPNLGMKIEMMAVKGQVDYLEPAMMPMEIGELNEEDWKFCLDAICNDTKYDQVLLDFGSMMPPEIVLTLCDEWYVVGEKAAWSQQLADRFLTIAQKVVNDHFQDKVKRIEW